MKIAIPSYKRQITLRDKTLAYLYKCNVPEEDIYIFTANEEEYKIYYTTFQGKLYNIVQGVETLCGQRNFITSYFNDGELVLNMDDDVEGLYYAENEKLHLFTDLSLMNDTAEELMAYHKTKICGVYAVANHFFMKEEHSSDLKYIVGCCWYNIIDKSPELTITLEDKEDFERSIKYYMKFGAVVRLNNICVKTNYYKENGGMQVTRTKKRVDESASFLSKTYPNLCEINTRKKDKEYAEVRLRDNAKHLKGGIF